MREEFGLATIKLNRHQRKNRLKQQQQLGCGINGGSGDDSSPGNVSSSRSGGLMTSIIRARFRLSLHRDGSFIRAVIASGTGPDGLAEARNMRKKRRFILQSLAGIVVSMLVITAKQKWNYISAVREGRVNDGGEYRPQRIDVNCSYALTEGNASKLSSLSSDIFSTTFDGNDDDSANNKEVSSGDCGDDDPINFTEREKSNDRGGVMEIALTSDRNVCAGGGDDNYEPSKEDAQLGSSMSHAASSSSSSSCTDNEVSCTFLRQL